MAFRRKQLCQPRCRAAGCYMASRTPACLRALPAAQGRRPEAEAEFRAVVAQRPSCALALGNLAGVLYDQVGVAV